MTNSNPSSPPSRTETYKTMRTHLLQPGLHEFHIRETSAPSLILPQTSSSSSSTTTSQPPSPSNLPTISSLSLHPTLESTLHILNRDLPSAHFLLRHAQDPPAWESMYLHGILHRVEGDVDNARAWYGDVSDSEVFRHVWRRVGGRSGDGNAGNFSDAGTGDGDGWKEYLSRCERWKESCKRVDRRMMVVDESGSGGGGGDRGEEGKGNVVDWEGEERELRDMSLKELTLVLEFCERKFGTGQVIDASTEYTRTEGEKAEIAKQMITGGEGWRQF